MTDLDDLIARLRNGSDGSPEAEAADVLEAMQAALDRMGVLEFFEQSRRDAAALASLRDEVARLQLEVHMAKSVALKMEAIIEQRSRVAPADEPHQNIPGAGSWKDGDTVFSIKENKVTHRFEGGRWVSQE